MTINIPIDAESLKAFAKAITELAKAIGAWAALGYLIWTNNKDGNVPDTVAAVQHVQQVNSAKIDDARAEAAAAKAVAREQATKLDVIDKKIPPKPATGPK